LLALTVDTLYSSQIKGNSSYIAGYREGYEDSESGEESEY